MVNSYKFRSTSVPVASYDEDVFGTTLPGHLSKARAAISHLDHLTHQSRRHDQALFDDLNSRASFTSALPPRTVRRHHVTPLSSHVTRRVVTGATALPRGISVPPVTDFFPERKSFVGDEFNLGASKRMSLAADTAVRHAHREVDRVERELSLSHSDPATVRRHRSLSVAAPSRATSVIYEAPLTHHNHTTLASSGGHHHHYYPGHSYQYESYPDYHQDSRHGRYSPSFELHDALPTKPLYSPLNLIRCLTDTHSPPVHHSYHEPLLLRSRSSRPLHSSSSLHLDTTPIHHTPSYRPLLTRSQSLHRPHKPSTLLLPESVGQWYHKPLSAAASRYYSSTTSLGPSLHYPSIITPPVAATSEVVVSSQPTTKEPRFSDLYKHYYHSAPDHTSDFSFNHHGDFIPHHHHNHHGDFTPHLHHNHHGDFIPHHHHNLHHTIVPTPHYHHHLSSTYPTTYPSLPPRPQITSSATYAAKAAVLTAPTSYLHTGLERPLDNHRTVSETRQRVREVLCKESERLD